jgi:hypothetical protein
MFRLLYLSTIKSRSRNNYVFFLPINKNQLYSANNFLKQKQVHRINNLTGILMKSQINIL